MQKEKIAHFDKVRFQNRKVIRNLMREVDVIGKNELVKKSGLSYPTVSAILDELIQLEEVKVMEQVVSNGGRPGGVFQLNNHFQHGVCAYIRGYSMKIVIYDVKGNIEKCYDE